MSDLRTAALRARDALALWSTGRDMDAVALNDLIAEIEAALAEPNRAQKMRDAGYTRRPTLREMAEPVQEAVRCPLCNYQYGHQIGCENNPVDIALAAAPPQRPAEPVAWTGYDLEGMVEAFSQVIEAHHSSKHPFHNPIDMDAKMALPILRGFIPAMKAYATPPQRPSEPQEPVAAVAKNATAQFDHAIGADRFKVVRGAFWWHVLIGDSTKEHGKFYSRAGAEQMAADLLREFRNGAFVQHTAPPTLRAAQSIIQPEIKDDKPFGYFRAEPFGWTDCAPTDEGAIPLYERPKQPPTPPEVQTEAEKVAYCAGWWAALEAKREPQGKLLPWKGLTEEEHTYYKACGFVGVKAVEEKLRARNSTLACHQGEEGK